MSRPSHYLLTMSLFGLCALLILLAVLFQFGIGTGYDWESIDANASSNEADNAIDRAVFKLPPQTDFTEIAQRPLFNEDRTPTPYTPDQPDQPEPPPPVALNINLTGIVLSHFPELRMVMIHDNLKNQSVALKEGMPLPGDQGGWTLVQVKERSVTFKSATGENVEMELKVASANQKGGPPKPGSPVQPGVVVPAAFGPGPPSAAANNPQAQDLQRRIEERRQQMREAADKMKQNRQESPAPSARPQQPQSVSIGVHHVSLRPKILFAISLLVALAGCADMPGAKRGAIEAELAPTRADPIKPIVPKTVEAEEQPITIKHEDKAHGNTKPEVNSVAVK